MTLAGQLPEPEEWLVVHYLTGSAPRSRQIFRANRSSISVCRGTAERRLFRSFPHQECRLPSLISAHPCCPRCFVSLDRFIQDNFFLQIALPGGSPSVPAIEL